MRRPNPNVLPERAREIWDSVESSTGSEQTVTVRCKLITPMHGGGVTAGEVDPDMPIRAGALRGQLRFWWRLLNGAAQPSSDLFAAESDLWGGLSSRGPRASRVTLQVKCAPVSDRKLITKSELLNERQQNFPTYALILEPRENPSFLNAGYTFDLVLQFRNPVAPRQHEGVVEALRWWASFAGVGARTRRGFGAVKATADGMELKPVSPEEVGRRGGWMVTGHPAHDATKAWKYAIDALQQFRQGRDVGRNPGFGNRPGRSRWPEADTIRRLKKTHAPEHKPQHPVDGFYPRAAFGLPLIFHFKDKGDPKGKDGDSLALTPAYYERMASPLILRPWFDGQRYRPAALLLPRWKERVSVRVSLDSERETPAWPKSPDERKRQGRQIEPMHAQEAADALSAFMGYFERRMNGGH